MKFILGSDSVTVYLDGKPFTINKQAQTYNAVIKGLRTNDEDAVRAAVNIRDTIVSSLTKSSGNKVQISNGEIMYGDRKVTGLVASRVFTMIDLGLSVDPMVRFIENLMQNPSKRAVDELFGFLDACNLPITEDGHFLAYKRVRADYKDCHSGTMDNSVGKVVSMERNAVDDNKEQTCSYGLHACSYSYLQHFGGAKIVVVKINPADVVSVPVDYNNAKLRTCRYEVVDEIPLNEFSLPSYELPEDYTSDYSDLDDDEYFEDEEDDFPDNTEAWKENPSAKLSAKSVIAIRRCFDEGVWDNEPEAIKYICSTWDISRRQAWRIVRREAWKNV